MTMKKKHWEAVDHDETSLRKVKQWAAEGEGLGVEFKRRATHPEKIVRELIAFANTNGGVLLVGVSDEGTIPGIKFPEEDAFVIRKAIHLFCRYALKYQEEVVRVSPQRFVLVYKIMPSNRKPCYMRVGRSAPGVFIRVGDKTIKASAEMKEIMRKRTLDGELVPYGKEEQQIIRFLHLASSATLHQILEHTHLSYKVVSTKLVSLVVAGMVRIIPREKGDMYQSINY
jgi:hypothetical protein